jgi:outer membrane biosynthesis protein TonB
MPFPQEPADADTSKPDESQHATALSGGERGGAEPAASATSAASETSEAVPRNALQRTPLKMHPLTGNRARYAEMDTTELVRLLDTIEDERARGRFRESIYISIFVWAAIAWVLFYGPRFLWHQKLINPVDMLRAREITELTAPPLPHVVHVVPKLDAKTLDKLRRETPPTPRPATPEPQPEPSPAPSQPAPEPEKTAPAPPPTPAPQPHAATPNIPNAPSPQPTPKVNFNSGPTNAHDSIANAMNGPRGGESGGYSGGGGRRGSPLNMGGAEVLSDTQGVDFDPYLRRILSDIRRNWEPLIPEEAEPPLNKQGETWIRFSIGPDGRILAMHLDGSTHDDAINRSCWGSITSEGQFPPLPAQFHGPDLELRIHYLVNKGPER